MWHTVFSMNGYEAYVWSCYGLTFLALLGFVWRSKRKKRQVLRTISEQASKY